MCVLSGFPSVQVNSSKFMELPVQWAELKVIQEKRPLTDTAWVASPTEYHHATAFLVLCWLLAVTMTLHSQMWGFRANWSLQLQPGSKTRWGCSHKWCWDAHPSGICHWEWLLCAKSQGGWLLTLATLLKAAESWAEVGSSSVLEVRHSTEVELTFGSSLEEERCLLLPEQKWCGAAYCGGDSV